MNKLLSGLLVLSLCFVMGCATAQNVNKPGTTTVVTEIVNLIKYNKAAWDTVVKNDYKGIYYEIAKMQVTRGDNIDLKYSETSENGIVSYRTLLILASISGDIKCVQFCIDNKANVNFADNDGFTALHEALYKGYFDIVKVLIKNNADINIRAKNGLSPLMEAAICGKVEIIQFLLENGADLNAKDNNQDNALLHACYVGNKDAAQFLLKKKADVSGLYIVSAASAGLKDYVQKFIKSGVDVNTRSASGNTALISAARYGYDDTVKLLLKNKADINAKNKAGESALISAIKNKKGKTAALLIESGSDKSEYILAMLFSAYYGVTDAAKALHKKGVEIDCRDDSGRTPLMFACTAGQLEMVKFLVENKASITERDNTLNGQTPLMTASFQKHPQIVKYLISKGADVNAVKTDGWSVINIAVQAGSLEVIKILVESGADKESKLKSGVTPLVLAIQFNHFDVFKYLLEQGANIKVKISGDTILSVGKYFFNNKKIDEVFYNYIVQKYQG